MQTMGCEIQDETGRGEVLRKVLIGGLLIFLAVTLPGELQAARSHQPIPLADWTTSSFPVGGGHIVESSPVLFDIDQDGQLEIIVGTTACTGSACAKTASRRIVVMDSTGTIRWWREPGAPIRSSPAVGDIDGDGDYEIVVTIGGDVYDFMDGGVVVYNHLGTELWRYNTYDYYPKDGKHDGVFSSPTLCDVDGNGYMEIIFGGWDQRIYMLDHTGTPLWYDLWWPGPGFYDADTVWDTAACADLNGDGEQEIIIGADITGGNYMPDGTPTQDGGWLYVFDSGGHVLARRFIPEAVYSSPAVGDLDGDGDLEIVVGTSWYWWDVHGRKSQPYVYAFDTSHLFSDRPYYDPSKLPNLPGWPRPTTYPGFSSPALADLDGDGDLEIIIGSGDPYTTASGDPIPGAGKIHVWHHTGEAMTGWPVHPLNWQGFDASIISSPTVADVDNDGQLEILFSMLWDVHIYGPNGVQETPGLQTLWTVAGSPAVGDTDGDGKVEIWIGGGNYYDQNQGYLWRFERNTAGLGATPWPMFHRDAQHTGYYPRPPRMSVDRSALYVMHQQGNSEPATATLTLRNNGDLPLNWSNTSAPSSARVQPASGTLPPHGSEVLTVTIQTTGFGSGTFALGNLRLTGSAPGGGNVLGSPADIAITLYVGHVYRVYLPLVLKPPTSSSGGGADLIFWRLRSYRIDGGQVIESSPILFDVDGDGLDEVIVGTTAQRCYMGQNCSYTAPTVLAVFKSDGTIVWQRNTQGPIRSSPAAGDINGDGTPEVVVTVGGDVYDTHHHGRVIAYNRQGTQLWTFATRDSDGNGYSDGIFSSPTLCDLEGDGTMEIILGSWDKYIYVLNHTGTKRWDYNNGWDIWSTAACVDFNQDGHKEIVIGASADPSSQMSGGAGGFLYVFDKDGNVLVRRGLPETVYSSPAVGDLDRDGDLEIVVGTGWFWWDRGGRTAQPYVYAFDATQIFSELAYNNPAKLPDLPGWPRPTDYPGFSSPALADLDGDGDLEVIIGTGHPYLQDDNALGAGSVYAWHHTGQLVTGWPIHRPRNQYGDDAPVRSSPTVADIDADGQPEILFSMAWDVMAYTANATRQLYFIRTMYTIWGSPAIGDTDGNGRVEVWIGGSHFPDPNRPESETKTDEHGYLWRFEPDNKRLGAYLGWPMFMHDAQHTGFYDSP